MKKRWRCTVCGYIHEGDSPPESCPVCHAGAEKFELVEGVGVKETPADQLKLAWQDFSAAFAPHAVAAHFPAALVPTTTLFLVIALVFGYQPLEFSAYAVLFLVVAATPVTMITGLMVRRRDYHRSDSVIFRKKIVLASVLLMVSSVTLTWRLWHPDVMMAKGLPILMYFLLHLLMLALVALLGHYGGVLIVARRK